MKIKAIIHPAEEGGYWAEVPAIPGCITEGDTWEEVIANLQDTVEGWLSVANNSRKSTEPTSKIFSLNFLYVIIKKLRCFKESYADQKARSYYHHPSGMPWTTNDSRNADHCRICTETIS